MHLLLTVPFVVSVLDFQIGTRVSVVYVHSRHCCGFEPYIITWYDNKMSHRFLFFPLSTSPRCSNSLPLKFRLPHYQKSREELRYCIVRLWCALRCLLAALQHRSWLAPGENVTSSPKCARKRGDGERKGTLAPAEERRASYNVCGYLCIERPPHCLRGGGFVLTE